MARQQTEEVVLAQMPPAPEAIEDEDEDGGNPAAAWVTSFQQLKQGNLNC